MATTDGPPPAPADATDHGPLIRLMLWLSVLSILFIIFVIWAPIDPWFKAATRQAREVDNLFKFMLAASGTIFIFVQGMLLTFALRYRRRKTDAADAIGPQVHGHTRLEVGWSAAPSLLLVVIVVLSLGVYSDEHRNAPSDLQLGVYGYQFGWSFSLPQYGIKNQPTVVLPVNQSVYVSETSNDVIHSFWVPEFRMKQDDVPGMVTHEFFTTIETGTFRVICTEYCGSGHSGMVAKITVASAADFNAWLTAHHATATYNAAAAQAQH